MDRTHRAVAARRLAASSGVDHRLVRWALLADDTVDIPWRVGAVRNAILLGFQGCSVLSIDDDVELRLVGPAAQTPRTRLVDFYNPPPARLFIDRAACLAWPTRDECAVRTLQQTLGRQVSDIVPGLPTHAAPGQSVAGPGARVGMVTFGSIGDCGMRGNFGWLHLRGDALRAAATSDELWCRLRQSRTVLRVPDRLTLSRGGQFMSMAFALDLALEVVPFLPVGRGSDAVFAATLREHQPDFWTAHLPRAVWHLPQDARVFPSGSIWRSVLSISLADTFCWSLGHGMSRVRAMSLPDFQDFVGATTRGRLAAMAAVLRQRLDSEECAPLCASWKADVRRAARKLEQRVRHRALPHLAEWRDLPVAAGYARAHHLLRCFADLLDAWDSLTCSAAALGPDLWRR